MNKAKLASAIGGAMFAALISGHAAAATDVEDLNVSASVASSCVITATSAVAFGAYDPVVANAATPLTTTGLVSVKCTKGSSAITIDLDKGLNAGAGTQRKMLGPTSTDTLDYNLYKPAATSPWSDCSGTTVWGSTAGGSVFTPTVTWASNAARDFTVCGSIPANQNVGTDAAYADTVVATVNF
jgi:spore coat protein U-like protein